MTEQNKELSVEALDWLFIRCEKATNRYIEAENLLVELLLPWNRIMGYRKIKKYLDRKLKEDSEEALSIIRKARGE